MSYEIEARAEHASLGAHLDDQEEEYFFSVEKRRVSPAPQQLPQPLYFMALQALAVASSGTPTDCHFLPWTWRCQNCQVLRIFLLLARPQLSRFTCPLASVCARDASMPSCLRLIAIDVDVLGLLGSPDVPSRAREGPVPHRSRDVSIQWCRWE